MQITYAGYTDMGRRGNNEDAWSICPRGGLVLAIVADGLGGHNSGEVASRIAAEAIPQALALREFDEDELGYAIVKTSDAICATGTGACTTVASLWIREGSAIAAHVGDSRIYQIRDGKIRFQSEDHSLVQVEISLGRLPKEACRNHRDRNKVYRVLGEAGQRPHVDIRELKVCPGDRFLLCTDGFWEPVTEEDMLRTLAQSPTPQSWLDAMKDLVIQAADPRQDNHTAIAVFAE